MDSESVRNFMGYLWYQVEDDIVTIGVNEEGLEEIDEILTVELPQENDKVEAEEVCGSIETNDGPLDIYTPFSGKIVEINSTVIEEPSLIQEDPYGDGWLIKLESSEIHDLDDDEDDEEDEDDDFDEDEESEEDEE